MRKNAKWLPEVVEFLKANIKGKTKAEMALLLNEKFGTEFTKFAVSTKCTELRINGGLRNWCRCYKKRPIGAEQTKKGYVKVKVAQPDVWRFKHHLEWEKKSGRQLQNDERVIFLDGNNRNFEYWNLECVTAGEQAVLNANFAGGIKGDAQATLMCLAAVRCMMLRVKVARKIGELSAQGSVKADVNRRARKKKQDETYRLYQNKLAREGHKRRMANPEYKKIYLEKQRAAYKKRKENKLQGDKQ